MQRFVPFHSTPQGRIFFSSTRFPPATKTSWAKPSLQSSLWKEIDEVVTITGDNVRLQLLLSLVSPADLNLLGPTGFTHLMNAVRNDDEEAVRLLLDFGADPNVRGRRGTTALILSASNPTILNLLIQNGANVNAQKDNGTTALMVAASAPNPESVEALLRAGANTWHRERRHQTAYDIATEFRTYTDEAEVLLAFDAVLTALRQAMRGRRRR